MSRALEQASCTPSTVMAYLDLERAILILGLRQSVNQTNFSVVPQ